MIILAVDYGDVRTGLAVCDKNQMLASPVGTVIQRNPDALIQEIAAVAKERQAEFLVVGEPVNMDGSRGERAKKCADFACRLAACCALPYAMIDERCTTVLAHTALNATNTRGKKRKAVIDAVSAVMILESYMARNPMKKEN